MTEKHVVVATFTLPIEAQVACGRLQAEGIAAQVLGDGGSSVFAGIDGITGRVELYVPAADYERAERILAACMPNEPDAAGQERATQPEEKIWVCSLCGDAVSDLETVCAACGTSREALRPASSQDLRENRPASRLDLQKDEPSRPSSSVESEFEMPALDNLHQGDVLAGRALKAALVTMFFTPVICWSTPLMLAIVPFFLVTFGFLVQLMMYKGELSAKGQRNVYLAVIIDVLLVAALLFYIFPRMY